MNISYNEVDNYCTKMKVVIESIKENLETISNECKVLENSQSWTGEAAVNYCEKFKKVTTNFNDVTNELDKCVLYIQTSIENYKKLESLILQANNDMDISGRIGE